MLIGYAALPKALLPRGYACILQQLLRPISTNSAINRALRKSKSRNEIVPTPYQSRRDALNSFSPARNRPERSRTSGTNPQSQYDYTPKAGGNRATRRASLFNSAATNPEGRELPGRSQFEPLSHRARRTEDYGSMYHPQPHPHTGRAWRPDGGPSRSAGKQATPGFHYPDSDSVGIVNQRNRSPVPAPTTSLSFRRDERHSAIPTAIPHTTPASEFLYGTSVIKAALQAKRRLCYKLYMYDGDNREVRDQDATIRKLSLDKEVVVQRVKGDWLRLMDKMSQGRPHNVCAKRICWLRLPLLTITRATYLRFLLYRKNR